MPDFYRETCNEPNSYCKNIGVKPCKSVTTAVRFGIIDDLTNESEPAFIQEFREENWQVVVLKQNGLDYKVTFKAIDKCIVFPLPKRNEDDNDICDGMLYFDNHLYFIEIKSWSNAKYTEKAISQLSRTIKIFSENHSVEDYNNRRAYISNVVKPNAPEGRQTIKDRFADENLSFDLIWSTEIKLP